MDEESTWDWPLVFTAVRDLLDKNVSSSDFKRDMVLKAKQCWDSNKRNTGGRVYKAAPLSKMAESVANKAKKFFDADLSKMASSKVLQMYTSTCSTPMPRSRGWRFKDTYVTETWQPAPDSSQNDCYTEIPYPFTPDAADLPDGWTMEELREFLVVFIESVFYQNDSYFETTIASDYAAFFKILTGVCHNGVGEGGDGKGALGVLEIALFGAENCTTLEPNVFVEAGEFRKSGHFAYNKMLVRLNELKRRQNFEYDIWKRAIVGEETDLRCNFGQTSKVRLRGMKWQQDCNFGELPVMTSTRGDVAPNNLVRRVIGAFVGKAKLVTDPADVDHSAGRYLKIPQEELESLLSNPCLVGMYLREILMPLWEEYGHDRLIKVLDADNLPADMKASSTWLCQQFCGVDAPLPNIDDDQQEASQTELKDSDLDMLAAVHALMADMTTIRNIMNNDRSCLIFPWRIQTHCSAVLQTSRSGAVAKFRQLLEDCGPLGAYLFKAEKGSNIHGREENGWRMYPVDAVKLLSTFRESRAKLGIELRQLRRPSRKYTAEPQIEQELVSCAQEFQQPNKSPKQTQQIRSLQAP